MGTSASAGDSQTPLTTGCRSSGSTGRDTFTDNGAIPDDIKGRVASAPVVTTGECATVVIAVTAVDITDFMTMFAMDGLEVNNEVPVGECTALVVLPAPLAVDAILETTSRIGGDTDLVAAKRDEPPWVAGEEINSAKDELRASPEAPDGRARSLMGTGFGPPLPELAGRASTGWPLVEDDEEAVVDAVRLPLKMKVSRCCGSLLAPPLLLLLPAVLHMEGEIIWPPGTCNVLEGTSAKLQVGWGWVLGITSAMPDIVVGREESQVVEDEQEEEGSVKEEEQEDVELTTTAASAVSEGVTTASDGVAID